MKLWVTPLSGLYNKIFKAAQAYPNGTGLRKRNSESVVRTGEFCSLLFGFDDVKPQFLPSAVVTVVVHKDLVADLYIA